MKRQRAKGEWEKIVMSVGQRAVVLGRELAAAVRPGSGPAALSVVIAWVAGGKE